jgi:hypothetical protein
MAGTKQSGKVYCLMRIMLLNQCCESALVLTFNEDPDPAFYINADRMKETKPIRIKADPNPNQTFKS